MRITGIDVVVIRPRLVARAAVHNAHYAEFNHRSICRVRTDVGITGYGDIRVPRLTQAEVQPLVGASPFDFIGNDFNPALSAALYDAMGKYLEQPAWKLIGPKHRDWISVAAWTKPAAPDVLAAEITRAAAAGYTLIKMHMCEFYDVREQIRAANSAAPPEFGIHIDMNRAHTLASIGPLVDVFDASPIVRFIENPFDMGDVEAWHRLRAKSRAPVILHQSLPGGTSEVWQRMADIYIIQGRLQRSLLRANACAAAGAACVLQVTGGTLAKAFSMHLAAAVPCDVSHTIDLDDQYAEDITPVRLPVINGSSPVPDGPGLGVEVDEEALAELAAREPTPVPKHVAVVRLPDGHAIYYPSLSEIDVHRMTGKIEGGIPGIRMELWDDDETAAFAEAYARVQREGPYIE